MDCIYEFINFLFNNSVFIGFLGVIIGAFLDYIIQTRLNKKQNKFTIEKKVLEGLI